MEEDRLCCVGFSHFFGIGPNLFQQLNNRFGSPASAFNSPISRLETVLGQSLAQRFVHYRSSINLKDLFHRIVKGNISVISITDNEYPQSLRLLQDPPICIYAKGNISLLDGNTFRFGVVGTRNPTSYGTYLCRRFIWDLAKNGLTIVSGMALGIDSLAHSHTLEAGGKTIAVLGCGVDLIYPPSNRPLYYRIIKEGGVILSEFPPGHTVRKGLFIVRNRIISGLSEGILVIEGTGKSGTLTTAKYAAEQGKTVFAPPVPITSEMSHAPSILLKQGAVLVTDAQDILDAFGMRKKNVRPAFSESLSETEKKMINLLEKNNVPVDEFVMRMKIPLSEVSETLSRLEVKGIVDRDETGNYRLRLI